MWNWDADTIIIGDAQLQDTIIIRDAQLQDTTLTLTP